MKDMPDRRFLSGDTMSYVVSLYFRATESGCCSPIWQHRPSFAGNPTLNHAPISDTLDTRHHEGRVIMKVVTLENIPKVPAEGAAEPIEGWTGAVSRSRQTIIEPGDSENFNCSVVNFSQGCTTGWHTHTCDQILIVTSGSGMVATEHEQREIHVGDVAHIKAGERHWHGAKADTTMGHITITLVDSQATWG
jgi:quercetin dioxygenase-like cupin family protein